MPDGLSPELAGVVTPMANGIQWALFDCGVGYDSRVLVQGPGQQGLSQVVSARQAGAALIIVTGTSKDAKRLEVARKLGADKTLTKPFQYQEFVGGIQEVLDRKPNSSS